MSDLRLKCTKYDSGWGSASNPAGSLQRSPRTLVGFKGREGKRREKRDEVTRRWGGEFPNTPLTVCKSYATLTTCNSEITKLIETRVGRK